MVHTSLGKPGKPVQPGKGIFFRKGQGKSQKWKKSWKVRAGFVIKGKVGKIKPFSAFFGNVWIFRKFLNLFLEKSGKLIRLTHQTSYESYLISGMFCFQKNLPAAGCFLFDPGKIIPDSGKIPSFSYF